MKHWMVVLFLFCAVLPLGCGGGSVGGPPPPPPPPPPPVSVSVSPTSANVQTSTTQQFTPTVTGTSNTAVTWSVNNVAGGNATVGTISSSGLYTAPASVPNPAAVTVKATSVADTTKSGSAQVTVTAPPPPPLPTIAAASPQTAGTFFLAGDQVVNGIEFDGTDFASDDFVQAAPDLNLLLRTFVNSIKFLQSFSLGNFNWSPGWFAVKDCRADGSGCSNPANLGFLGNLNTLVGGPGGELFQLDQAQGLPPGQNGFIRKFRSDGVADGGFFVGALYNNLAIDEVDGLIFLPTGGGISSFDLIGTAKGGATNGKMFMALASAAGIVCGTQPNDGLFTCFLGKQILVGNPPMTSAAAGSQPWALTMFAVGAETDALVYSRESLELRLYKVENVNGTINITLKNALTVTGFTPASQLSLITGGWHLVAFESGSASGKAALSSNADKMLVVVDLGTMTELRRASLQVGLPGVPSGVPFRIAADVTHGTVIAAFADAPAGLTRFTKVDVATATVTNPALTSNLLSVGLLVSANGTSIYAAMRDRLQVVPNQ